MSQFIKIKSLDKENNTTSFELQKLQKLLEQELKISIIEVKTKNIKEKNIGFTTGLEIAGLTLSALSTFISVLQYWKSKNPRYSIKYEIEGIEISILDLSEKEFNQKIQEINKVNSSPKHTVIIRDLS